MVGMKGWNQSIDRLNELVEKMQKRILPLCLKGSLILLLKKFGKQ